MADASIALRGDPAQFIKDAVKYGSEGGDQAGAAFASRFGPRAQSILGTTLGAALGLTAKNMLDLDAATKRFAADVGATADETDRAKRAANELFKTSTAGYDQILGVMAKLRTDQGLNQEDAQQLTRQYLDFAKVTGQDAATGVKQLDDILDAYNLKARDGVGIMDKLVASHQKFGGSIPEEASALAQMAPALEALNLKVDDGIALLNVFASTGLDASQSQMALKHAIETLPPGTSLKEFIAHLATVPDAGQRASEAIAIFGSRGGAALANAFRPGLETLDAFGIASTDASGKVNVAAREIESSIGNQIILKLHELQGTLVEVLGPAGPILSGAGSIALLATNLKALGVPLPSITTLLAEHSTGQVAVGTSAALAATSEGLLAGAIAEVGAGSYGSIPYVLGLAEAEDGLAVASGTAAAAGGGLLATLGPLAIAIGAAIALNDEWNQKLDFLAKKVAAVKQAQHDANAATDASRVSLTAAERAERQATDGLDEHRATLIASERAENNLALAQRALNLEGLRATTMLDGLGKIQETFATQTDHVVRPLSVEAAWLDVVAFKASVAARNIAAMYGGTAAAHDRRLRQLGEAGGAGASGGLTTEDPSGVYTVPTLPDAVPWPKPPALGGSGVSDTARAIKSDMQDAFRSAKTAADDFFDALHKHNLDAIEGERGHAYAIAQTAYEQKKAAILAPVTDAEKELSADQARRRERDLRESLSGARANLATAAQSGDPQAIAAARRRVRDATEALSDYLKQSQIAQQKTAAELAISGPGGLDDQLAADKKAADEVAAAKKTAEDARATAQKKAFDDELTALEKHLGDTKVSHAKALAEIQKIYDKAGIDAKANGSSIGKALAAGLKGEVKAVESGMETLLGAVTKYLKLDVSPAAGGATHKGKGLQAMHHELAAAYPTPALSRVPSSADIAMVAGNQSYARGAINLTADFGPIFERIFGTRLIEYVADELNKNNRT